ncbi:MAG: hypothetical protein M1828_003655 [Chrysothrix sp. TS-e1954]|nr:MAG: hypothetical protein M1828_003655 [Chrysothrix sp. TS-e1954]
MLELRRRGLPMPPYNPIFGHLAFCAKVTAGIPGDAHPNYLPYLTRRLLPELGPVFYIDTWPFGPQMLYVGAVESLHQMTQEHPLGKYHAMKPFLKPITDGLDIVTMEGAEWKTWRGIFNPGFSTGHLMTLTTGIIEETLKFCDILREHADSKIVFRMKDLTDNLAMDVIGRVALGVELDCQRRPNALVDGLRSQVRWLTFGADVNPFKRYNPLRPLVHWYNARRMDRYIAHELDHRIAEYQDAASIDQAKKSRSIIDLALSAYTKENGGLKGASKTFRKFAMSQIKLFLFSGHDTTSSSICYIYYILSKHPRVLQQVANEHDQILGSDQEASISAINATPALLNQLPYTVAAIKETLRLYPAVSSVRAGEPNFHITDDAGRRFPTDGFMVWANPQPIHRDPAYWPRAEEFLPERWMVRADDPLHPVKGAWRPFEFGPRNCIGQELAMLEMKIIMVLTVRTFHVTAVYDEVDGRDGSGKKGRNVCGERGYQIQRAQPSDDLPCRVQIV